MKKSLLIVALAIALMLVFAAPALAKYAGYTATDKWVNWSVANSQASLNPDSVQQAFGPHAGYATTTIKCAACHSVHRGGNKILNGGANGCSFCHTSACMGGGSISSNIISWYGTGPHSSCASSYCHSGAHGVGVSVYAGPASKLIVKAADAETEFLYRANGYGTGYTAGLATWSANTRVLSTGAVCGRLGCHEDSLFGVITSGTTKDLMNSGNDGIFSTAPTTTASMDETVTAHRVIATATSTWNMANEFNPPSSKTGTIAYASVTYCNSCHDLKDTSCNNQKPAFPHSINGVVDSTSGADGTWRVAVWLTAGAFAGDTNRAAVGEYNQYAITARNNTKGGVADGISEAAGSSVLDGTCLKCHRGGAGASGVGKDY